MSRDLRASSEAFRASMDAFDESMAAGDPVPFVAAEDVKHWWNCWRRILNRFPQLKERKERTAVGIDLLLLQQFELPAPAVWCGCGT